MYTQAIGEYGAVMEGGRFSKKKMDRRSDEGHRSMTKISCKNHSRPSAVVYYNSVSVWTKAGLEHSCACARVIKHKFKFHHG